KAEQAAQQRQADYLLDQVGCRRGSRLLDIGCGYGRLLDAAAARGADAIGLTISPPQAQQNRAAGRAVELCNYRSLLVDGRHEGWERAFDAVIANGSLEHFVQAEEAAAHLDDDVYREFFVICRQLLRRGGRLATTAIHWRRRGQMDPADMTGDPGRWPRGSFRYHLCSLHRSFGGWYPEPGQLQRCAAGLFRLTAAQDGTRDYHLTSREWVRRMRVALTCDVRTWPAPTQLWRHTWIAA
ncbi:MAG TPA: class I SAM-dependent methyltransferase, partial [Lacipirellulaceae bacterium]|nr:class I SAM-dependent methyltransferase [Lacipirellulaceae bacterium]